MACEGLPDHLKPENFYRDDYAGFVSRPSDYLGVSMASKFGMWEMEHAARVIVEFAAKKGNSWIVPFGLELFVAHDRSRVYGSGEPATAGFLQLLLHGYLRSYMNQKSAFMVNPDFVRALETCKGLK